MVNPIVLVMNADFQWIMTKIDMKPDTTAVISAMPFNSVSRDDNKVLIPRTVHQLEQSRGTRTNPICTLPDGITCMAWLHARLAPAK